MKLAASENYLRECLKQARFYEFCTDAERALTVLKPIWRSIEEPPDIEGLDPVLACEILLVCGGVVSYYGQVQQKKAYQEVASDLLTRAREAAAEIGIRELIAEAEKQTALAYFRLGQYENSIAYLNTLLGKYTEAEQLTETVCLAAQTNLLMIYMGNGEPVTAYDLLRKIEPHIAASDDLWLKNMFFNQAAGVLLKAGNFNIAVPFLEKAVELSHINRNTAFLGNALNNLALVHLTLHDTALATTYINQAIEAYSRLDQVFFLGIVLETKAQIQIAKGNLKDALYSIEESIGILEKGENYPELAESLWTKTVIIAAQGDKRQTIRQFTRLMQIVESRLSLVAANFYTEQFSGLIYFRSGSDFYEQSENFRIQLLDYALGAGGGVVKATAARLGISHQNTSKLLKKYPELCEKHQVKLRERLAPPKARTIEKTISAVKKTGAPTVSETFALTLKSNRLEYLGLPESSLVEVRRADLSDLDLSKPVVIKDKQKNYHCGFLVDSLDMFAFEDGRGNIERIFVVSEIAEVGQIIGIYDEESENFISLENL